LSLDITPLNNAIERLREGLGRYQKDTTDEQIRDGLIQRFEFTYELSHKMLKRYLMHTSASPQAIEEMTFQDLIRTGAEQNLLHGGWPEWRKFREMRAKSSHTYSAQAAGDVVAVIPDFLAEAQGLCAELKKRLP